MSLKATWLLMILLTGGFRFGGSVGTSSHAVAGGSASAELSQEGHDGKFVFTKSSKNGFADWSGTAGAGGYVGQGQTNHNPNAKVSGIGGGAAVSAHLGRSVSAEIMAKIYDGKIDKKVYAVTAAEKSIETVGAGFIGNELQGEADRLSSFGYQAGHMPAYGASYGPAYGNLYGPRYASPQAD